MNNRLEEAERAEQAAKDKNAAENWHGPDTSLNARLEHAHAVDAARNRARMAAVETAMLAHPRETAAQLHYKWAVPLQLVERLLAVEAELFITTVELESVKRKIELLEQRRK
jgi:uncharacterized membrane protein YhfC